MLRRLSNKNWIPVGVLLAAAILCIGSLYAPWWSIRNPAEQQINTNITNNAFYNPLQTISANHVEPEDNNNTFSVTVPFSELGPNATDTDMLGSIFSTTLYIAVSGMVLVILALALVIVSVLRKPLFAFSWILSLAGTILLLVASIYIVAQMPEAVETLPTVMPSQVAVVSGSNLTGFWGSTKDWTWGAGLG